MKARVITSQIQPGKLDEATRIFRESTVSAASEHEGCKAMFLVADRASGKGISISIWEEQALQSSEASGFLQKQVGRFDGMFASPPVREIYDVAIWERSSTDPTNVRVVTVLFKQGELDAGVAHYRDKILPAARDQQGFLGALLLTEPISGKALSATVWSSESAMTAGQVSGGYLDQQIAGMVEFLAAPPTRDTFEVAVRWARQA